MYGRGLSILHIFKRDIDIFLLKLGIQSDDIILSSEDSLPVLQEEVIVTEKLDGGNCCIHDGIVGLPLNV